MSKSFLAIKFECFLGLSGLIPNTTAFNPSKVGRASVNSQASVVHPGVLSFG
jgi:hypothetical protein